MKTFKVEYSFAALRLTMGFIFLWAFLDKTFGLGFETAAEKAWLKGGSPTTGFLQNAVYGPFMDFYHNLAGNPVVDWLFMLGLLGIGVSLILGIGLRVAALSGTLMMLLMWSSMLPPVHNPIVDEHIVYALILLLLPHVKAGDCCGLGKEWRSTRLVKKYPFLA